MVKANSDIRRWFPIPKGEPWGRGFGSPPDFFRIGGGDANVTLTSPGGERGSEVV